MSKENKKIKLYKKKSSDKNTNYKWIMLITLWTFLISGSIGFISNFLLSGVGIFFAFFILITIIIIGIIFDIIGVAVTAADEVPFHSLASRKVTGAKTAVKLIRNADKVSNFCNDVIGDICGVLSGAAGGIIISKLMSSGYFKNQTLLALVISAMIASLTVGGKALGKNFAMTQSNNIVYNTAWIIEKIKVKRK